MPLIEMLPVALVMSALAGGLLLLAAGVALCLADFGRRLTRLRAEVGALAGAGDDRMQAIAARLEAAIAALDGRRDSALSAMAADLAAVRAEVEWLGGERMIEEAVRMCRDGVPHARISEDLGLSPDSVRVISLLRSH